MEENKRSMEEGLGIDWRETETRLYYTSYIACLFLNCVNALLIKIS